MPENLKFRCRFCSQKLDVSELEPFTRVECPSCSASLVVPRPLDDLLLEGLIGEGGMAWVYRAIDTNLDRRVAVKIPFPEIAANPENAESFLREARAAASVNHPNVVSIYACGKEESGEPYLVMELMSNFSFDHLLRRRNGYPFEEHRALAYLSDAARGLQGALWRGTVHHDVKPGNILMDNDGNVKVGDFGLARIGYYSGDDLEGWGSPYFMSPEKVRTGGEDYRGDIYSLGGTLFYLLAGRVPFDGKDAEEITRLRLNRAPPDIREINPEVSKQTADTVRWTMQENPDERPQSYDELLEHFTAISTPQGHMATIQVTESQQDRQEEQTTGKTASDSPPKRRLKWARTRAGEDTSPSLESIRQKRRRRQRARMINWGILFGILGLIGLILIGVHRHSPWATEILRQYNRAVPSWMVVPAPSSEQMKPDRSEVNNKGKGVKTSQETMPGRAGYSR